jgi:N-acetylmuramoyl-L-alanine amidase
LNLSDSLNNTRMPASIPEIAFVDNETDQAAIRRPGWAEQVGQALARARLEAVGEGRSGPL